MRILALETSTPVISVAVGEDQEILAEAAFSAAQAHLERLLPVIDDLLNGLRMTGSDLDAFAVGVGPGSFTSLRVGLATGKALAHALRKPLVGVPTLDTLAWGLKGVPDLICPVLTARRDEVYACFYVSAGGGMKRLSKYMAISPQELAVRLQEKMRARVTFTGEGARAYWDIFRNYLGKHALLAEPAQLWPRAGILVKLGGLELMAGGDRHPGEVGALYIKPPAIRRQ